MRIGNGSSAHAAVLYQATQAELYFYGKVFGFTPADELPPVEILNPPP